MDGYLRRREQLISADRASRVDRDAFVELGSLMHDADSVVRGIRSSEALSVWGPESDAARSANDATHIFPGMGFLTARDIILGTNLFKIISQMPKGALLHAHLDATVNSQILLQLALQHENLHIRTTARVTASNIGDILPEFKPIATSQTANVPSITDETYAPGDWVPLSKARHCFDSALGGPNGFDRWFTETLTISPAEAYRTHNTTAKIWKKFSNTFIVSHPLVYYAPIWREYIREFFLSSVKDGISYVEVRINFFYRYMYGEDGQENLPHREWLLIYDYVLREVKERLKAQGRGDGFFSSKIIYSTLRTVSPQELEWYLEDCIALKQEFPHLITGFDLVGHEDSLRPLIEYIEPLTRFSQRVKDLGLDIPFIFHAGETLGDGTAADMNLYDAILLGTKRIGHGFSLIKHPELMAVCKSKNIAVEICPISNEILRLTTSMPMHPLPALMNHGVPVSLCSDDPAVFGNMGLSFDFFQVLVASEVNSLRTMGELARGSFKHACLSQEEREEAMTAWERQWRMFIEWVVQEWSPKASSKGLDKI